MLLLHTIASSKESREITKTQISKGNFNKRIQEYSIKHERLYTYITLGICKLWIQFEEKTFDILKMLNFEAVSQEIAKDIELMIFSRSKIPLMSVLENRTKIQKLLEPNIIFFVLFLMLEHDVPLFVEK